MNSIQGVKQEHLPTDGYLMVEALNKAETEWQEDLKCLVAVISKNYLEEM